MADLGRPTGEVGSDADRLRSGAEGRCGATGRIWVGGSTADEGWERRAVEGVGGCEGRRSHILLWGISLILPHRYGEELTPSKHARCRAGVLGLTRIDRGKGGRVRSLESRRCWLCEEDGWQARGRDDGAGTRSCLAAETDVGVLASGRERNQHEDGDGRIYRSKEITSSLTGGRKHEHVKHFRRPSISSWLCGAGLKYDARFYVLAVSKNFLFLVGPA